MVLLGALGAAGIASGATAASDNVATPGWLWYWIEDNGTVIVDVEAIYEDYAGSGLDMWGWTIDAFDDFIDTVEVSYNGGAPAVPVFAPISATYVDDGLTTTVGAAVLDFGGGATFDLGLTLNVQGSYASWSFVYASTGTGDPNLLATFVSGNLGSDSNAHYTLVNPTALVADDQNDHDPVIGMQLVAPGGGAFSFVQGADAPAIDFAGVTGGLVLSIIDYDMCSFDAAVAAMTALAPTLSATFGTDNAPIYSPTCMVISPPAQIGIGDTTDQHLALTPDAAIATEYDLMAGDAPDWYRAMPLDLPAGLSLVTEYDPGTGEPNLHLTGTAPAGTYLVHVLQYYDGGGGYNSYPIVSTITVEVVLAATGSESASLLWIALGLVGIGAGLFGVSRRVRPREW